MFLAHRRALGVPTCPRVGSAEAGAPSGTGVGPDALDAVDVRGDHAARLHPPQVQDRGVRGGHAVHPSQAGKRHDHLITTHRNVSRAVTSRVRLTTTTQDWKARCMRLRVDVTI